MLICCNHIVAPEQNIYDKVLPAIFSGCIVVSLFIVGRLLDRAIKSKEIRRNWYQKVIIDPNIIKLNKFYSDVLIQLCKSIEHLEACQTNKMPYMDYLDEKAKEGSKLKELKRAFEFEFVMLVQANFSEIGDELANYLLDFEDVVMKYIDKAAVNKMDFVGAEREIATQKNGMYRILYEPLKFKRPSFIKLIKSFF